MGDAEGKMFQKDLQIGEFYAQQQWIGYSPMEITV